MLTTQIENGAPFDLFLSADLSYPKRLIDDGLADAAGSADSTTPITYAKGTLVLWERKDSHLPPPSLDLLRDPQSQAARHRQSRPRALRPRRRRRAHQPQSLRHRSSRASSPPKTSPRPPSSSTPATPMPASSRSPPRSRRASPASGTYFVIPRNLYPPIEQGASSSAIPSSAPPRTSCSTFCSRPRSRPNSPKAASRR
jgi:molybdate transport system substrate-binding protein